MSENLYKPPNPPLIMEIKVLENKKNRMVVELPGETHTFANLIRNLLWNDKDVNVAAYRVEHPLVGKPQLMIETKKGEPKKALLKAAESMKKLSKEFWSKVARK